MKLGWANNFPGQGLLVLALPSHEPGGAGIHNCKIEFSIRWIIIVFFANENSLF